MSLARGLFLLLGLVPFLSVVVAPVCPTGAGIHPVKQQCELCSNGQFAYNDACEECWENSFTNAERTWCICDPGWVPPNATERSCLQCPSGRWEANETEVCITCDSNFAPDNWEFDPDIAHPIGLGYNGTNTSNVTRAYSQQGASNISQCFCEIGYVGDGTGACTPCPSGQYYDLVNRTCGMCGNNSATSPGDVGVESCVCDPGYSGDGTVVCTACQVGYYERDDFCFACHLYATSEVASTTCGCNAGYVGDGTSNCTACTDGFWRSLEYTTCQQCDIGQHDVGRSPVAAPAVGNCSCNSSYVYNEETRVCSLPCECRSESCACVPGVDIAENCTAPFYADPRDNVHCNDLNSRTALDRCVNTTCVGQTPFSNSTWLRVCINHDYWVTIREGDWAAAVVTILVNMSASPVGAERFTILELIHDKVIVCPYTIVLQIEPLPAVSPDGSSGALARDFSLFNNGSNESSVLEDTLLPNEVVSLITVAFNRDQEIWPQFRIVEGIDPFNPTSWSNTMAISLSVGAFVMVVLLGWGSKDYMTSIRAIEKANMISFGGRKLYLHDTTVAYHSLKSVLHLGEWADPGPLFRSGLPPKPQQKQEKEKEKVSDMPQEKEGEDDAPLLNNKQTSEGSGGEGGEEDNNTVEKEKEEMDE